MFYQLFGRLFRKPARQFELDRLKDVLANMAPGSAS